MGAVKHAARKCITPWLAQKGKAKSRGIAIPPWAMSDFYSRTHEDLPGHYDADLGPVIFHPFAIDIARRAATASPPRVLETACGTGIVTRALLDALPPGTPLVATGWGNENACCRYGM